MGRERAFTSFKELKKILETNPSTLPLKEPIQEQADEIIFREAMSNVREIEEFRKLPVKKPREPKNRFPKKDDSHAVLREIVDGKKKITLSDTGEYREWTCPHAPKDIVKKLHMGGFSVQDSIDLHGLTLHEAEEAFSLFFKEAVRRRLFCIKVIHGRGLRSPKGPVLKKALGEWLHGNMRKWVLAYATAKDCDGGLGATYVILK